MIIIYSGHLGVEILCRLFIKGIPEIYLSGKKMCQIELTKSASSQSAV